MIYVQWPFIVAVGCFIYKYLFMLHKMYVRVYEQMNSEYFHVFVTYAQVHNTIYGYNFVLTHKKTWGWIKKRVIQKLFFYKETNLFVKQVYEKRLVDLKFKMEFSFNLNFAFCRGDRTWIFKLYNHMNNKFISKKERPPALNLVRTPIAEKNGNLTGQGFSTSYSYRLTSLPQ